MGVRTRRFPNERLAVLVALGIASGVAVAVDVVREVHYARGFGFLVWNLFLAWIPLVLALLAYDRYRRGARFERLLPALVLWLLFLPNAPYIFTDFIHLGTHPPAPLWFDGLMLSVFAWTGLLLGFVSLYLVQCVVRHRFGGPVAWWSVLAILGLTSVGVFLGRFKHWNSWDVIVSPGGSVAELYGNLTDPASVARATAATAALTTALALAYLVFYALMAARLEPARDS